MTEEKTNFPYVVGPQKLTELLKKIPDIGIPKKFTLKQLKSLGYTSSNDERFVPALKFIGLLGQSGVPTDLWHQARADLGVAVAKGVRAGYSDLFDQYPNAHQKDDEALRTYFTVQSGTGKDAVTRMVSTFKAFVDIADFGRTDSKAPKKKQADSPASNDPAGNSKELTSPAVPTVAINIQLQLPPDPTGETYEKFFSAMAKHLPVNTA